MSVSIRLVHVGRGSGDVQTGFHKEVLRGLSLQARSTLLIKTLILGIDVAVKKRDTSTPIDPSPYPALNTHTWAHERTHTHTHTRVGPTHVHTYAQTCNESYRLSSPEARDR